jgi:hypothetical protein
MSRLMSLLALAIMARAQQPYAKLPRNYTLEFENESVRISRVKYFPGDKLPVHSHPSIPTVYIYLTDGGLIRFIHETPQVTIVRGEVKAGGVRFNRNARVETHRTEYLGDSESEYLRVELKTAAGPPHLDTRLSDDGDFPWEDPQVRIGRFHGVPPTPVRPALLVDISARRFSWLDPKDARAPSHSQAPGWYVMLELKTDPATKAP